MRFTVLRDAGTQGPAVNGPGTTPAPRSAIQACLACGTAVPFRQGLETTVRWYADNRAWWEPLKQGGPAPVPAGSGRVS